MTTFDLPLFNHNVAPHNGTDTSADAAESIRPHLNAMRALVLSHIKTSEDGLTCEQLEALTGLKHQTVSARLNELATCTPPFVVHQTDPTTGKPRTRRNVSRRPARLYFSADIATPE